MTDSNPWDVRPVKKTEQPITSQTKVSYSSFKSKLLTENVELLSKVQKQILPEKPAAPIDVPERGVSLKTILSSTKINVISASVSSMKTPVISKRRVSSFMFASSDILEDRPLSIEGSVVENKENFLASPSKPQECKEINEPRVVQPPERIIEEIVPRRRGRLKAAKEAEANKAKPLELETSAVETNKKRALSEDDHQIEESAKKPKTENTESTASTWKIVSSASAVAGPSRPTGNYLKLNIRQKCFSKGGSQRQRFLRGQFKREKYKNKFGGGGRDRFDVRDVKKNNSCLKCGQEGHWASKCPSRFINNKKKPNTEPEKGEEFYSTAPLEEFRILTDLSPYEDTASSGILEPSLNLAVGPLVNPEQDGFPTNLRQVIGECMTKLGVKTFRTGQEEVVWRVLSGKTTLVVLPTGAGKSLCYQLPALVYSQMKGPCVALVVSPLISLMQDQLESKFVNSHGAFLNSTQTLEQRETILEKARAGQYSFLLVSPEALVESDWLFRSERLPPISFACIDEAHCLADWSHHFRPSYLRVCQIVRDKLGVNTFLGLSATCTKSTIVNICQNLGIENAREISLGSLDVATQGEGYIQPIKAPLPQHLLITASQDSDRDQALLTMLTKAPFNTLSSILVYASSREQTARVAGFIRTSLKDEVQQVGKKKLAWTAEAYHAGQTAAERRRVQNKFMKGKLRVVVATNAFGMGVDKQDLEAVIHYALPRSFENYVQEAGRVGRGGQQVAYCHAFVPPMDLAEANLLRRHVFGNSLDALAVKRFLLKLMNSRPLAAIHPASWAEELDIQAESLGTLLAYLDLYKECKLISILPPGHAIASIDCYGGPRELARASKRCLALAASLGLEQPENLTACRSIRVNLARISGQCGWPLWTMKRELSNLQWTEGCSGVKVNFEEWSWWVYIHEPALDDQEMDRCLVYLLDRLKHIEHAGLTAIAQLSAVVNEVAFDRVEQIYPLLDKRKDEDYDEDDKLQDFVRDKSSKAHELIADYFMGDYEDQKSVDSAWPVALTESQEFVLQRQINAFLDTYGPSYGRGHLTGRAVANIFHGISSPQYPATTWGRVKRFWRCQLEVDWPSIKRLAVREILSHGL